MKDKLVLSAWRKPPEDLDQEKPDLWYKGEYCLKFPYNRATTVEDILYGWTPPSRLITAETKVLAFGSCFAEYFIKFLAQHSYNRWRLPADHGSTSGENLLIESQWENIFVIVQQLRWAFHEFTPHAKLWFTKDKRQFEATDERRERLRRGFEEGDVFVITLGLSEIWFDQIEGEAMWRSVPASLYEPERHVWRPTTVSQTLASLYEFDGLADRFLPGKKFIFTLSPIPLRATFRNQSAVTANQASKAILRAALDEFFADPNMARKSRYHYFPSYEIVLNMFEHPFLPDNRHIRPEVAEFVLGVFSNLYTDLPAQEVQISAVNSLSSLLEQQIRDLEAELEKKEIVIRELDHAAKERLDLINQLTKDR